jgi:hypothetical protein
MNLASLRIVSDYHVIEIDDHCLKYRPRARTRFSFTTAPVFRDQLQETMLAEGQVSIIALARLSQ